MAVRVAAGDLADETVETMDGSGGGKKHKGALSGNDLDSVLLAECDCGRTDGAFAGGAVHPDSTDAGFGTIGDDCVRHCGRGHQESGVDRWVDVLHASEAGPAEHIRSAGIDRKHVITAAAEFFEEHDAKVARFPRDANHGDSLLSQEVLDCFERLPWRFASEPGSPRLFRETEFELP